MQSLVRNKKKIATNLTDPYFISATFLMWVNEYFLCKCLSTTVYINGTVQFTFFLVMRLNITTATSCDSLIILVTYFFIIKA